MKCVTRPRITELNPHLLCVLCEGYLIDATAITECLHAFCKKCIVQYLETKKYCPVCDVLVHKTKPLQNIKPDKILQSIVYKSVPDLYRDEMCNRRRFYSNIHPQQHPEIPELRGEITEASDFYTVNDTISLSLEYINFLGDQNYFYVASSSKRYLRCDATVTVKLLQKLMSAKYGLAVKHEIRFFFNGIQLPEHLTLLDIAYISSWKRNGFIRLLYQILEVRKTAMKLENKETTAVMTPTPTPITVKSEDNKVDKLPLDVSNCVNDISEQAKESKLSTSSVTTASVAATTITTLKTNEEFSCTKPPPSLREPLSVPSSSSTSLNNPLVTTPTSILNPSTTLSTSKSNENSILNKIVEKLEKKASTGNSNVAVAPLKLDDEVNQPTAPNNNKENAEKTALQPEKTIQKIDTVTTVSAPVTTATTSLKKKSPIDCPIPTKIPKLLNSDSPKPSKVDICKEVESINTPIMSVNSTASLTSVGLKFIPSNPITPAFNYSVSSNKITPPPPALRKIPMCYPAARVSSSEQGRPIEFPSTTTTSIKKAITGVKTFTRPWSYATAPSVVAPVKPTTISDSAKNINEQKPVRFHKAARRNVPRFLGNPSSGIRPLYQGNSPGATSTPDGKSNSTNDSIAKKALKQNISLLKVDPKTLGPITSSSSSSKSNLTGTNLNKKAFYMTPKSYTTMSDYPCSVTNSTFIGCLPSVSATSTKLPSNAAFSPPFPNIAHNPLLNSINLNPFLCGMYQSHFPSTTADGAVNGPTSLDYIKAMAAYHPSFPTPINSIYNPQHHHKLKQDKVKMISKPASSPPAIQRIPPTSKTPTSSEGNTVTDTSKALPISSTTSNVSNGVYKNKSKKESSFAINNLIPIDEAKNITHSCSADGVHQVCDQVSPAPDPVTKKTIVKELNDKSRNDKETPKEEKKDTNGEKNS